MTISAKHFDTRLGQDIETYDKEAKKQEKLNSLLPKTEKITLLKEELNNTLLEYFFPNAEFSFGHGDEFTTIDELKNHSDNHKLLISSKSRYLYADESAFEIVDEIFPDRKDRGAYGSILLGECNKDKDSPPPLEGKLNILIVDDETGNNGGVIDKEQAYRLTGDCYGQISDEIYKELTGHKYGDKYRIIQHRFGWKPQEADDKYRFGKGTLRPMDFADIQYEPEKKGSKIDLIIPISSLKGTDKQRPGGALKPQIKPGLYELDMWLGEKSLSQEGKIATSQVWTSFSEGQKDALEKSDADAYKLYIDSGDPRKLAQLYCEKYEKHKKFDQERLQKENELAASGKSSAISIQHNQDEDEKTEVEDLMMYRLIKADLASGHGQLLETEKVKRELEKFVVKEYLRIATFKNITFDRAMVIPSKDLKNGEICILGRVNDAQEILNFRAPFLNSNGMCVSRQKHTDDILGPDGNHIEGVICVSDETTERIYDRVTEQIKTVLVQADDDKILNSFKPFVKGDIASIQDIKFKDIGEKENMQRVNFVDALNEQITNLQNLGFEIETLPRESEQERQGRDYDGDCVGFTLAENFPNLTAEALERNKPENAYLPTIKEAKKSFYIDDTTEQPEFEAIALQMSDSISVGVINNHLTALEALESEIEIIRNFGDNSLIRDYIVNLNNHYSKILEEDDKQDNPFKKIPEAHRDYMKRISELAESTNSPEVIDNIFDINKDFYRRLNEEASYQNQIAVDLFKSNRVPDTDAIKRNSSYLHRKVNYIRDKKQEGVYQTKVIETTGYSPTEINIRRVNRHFAKHKIESRPIFQFQNLFKGVEFSSQLHAEAILAKRNFDKYFNEAASLQKRQKIDEGQSVYVRTRNGLNFEVTNVVRTGNFSKLKEALEQDKAFKIEVKKSKNKAKPHKYEVYAQFNNEKNTNGYSKYQQIGTVMRDDEHIFKDMDSLPKNLDTKVTELKAAISDAQIKVRFDKALESADAFRKSIPDPQLEQYAAATWSISTKRDTSDTELGFNKRACFAFNTFTNEIIDKIETLRFDAFTITNLHEAELQPDAIDFSTPQEIRFGAAAIEKNGNTEIKNVIQLKTSDGEYKEIGDISSNDGRLPLGTTASATITNGNLSTATLTIDNVSVKVNELNKYDTKVSSGEEVEVLIKEGASVSDGETKIFIGNDYLGKLRPESHEEAIKNNWLQNNQSLQLKLDSIVDEGKHPYAIATTNEGNKLYVNIEDQMGRRGDGKKGLLISHLSPSAPQHLSTSASGLNLAIPNRFKGYSFDSEQVQAKPIIEKTGQKAIVFVNDKPIGTISKEDFKKIEITGASSIPKPAKIEGNITTLKVTLDKETIQYPDVWVKERKELTGKESIAINTSEESYKVDEISSQLYQKITTRQSIAFEDTVDKYTNTFNLAVDERQLEATEKYLDKNNIDFNVVEKEDRNLEASKGMRVISIDKESLTTEIIEAIISRTGEIKSDIIEVPEIPIFKDESAYYFDPKANYGNKKYPAIGLAVPAPDSHLVSQFIGKYNLKLSGFNDGNISYFSVIDVENFSSEQYNEIYPASEEQFTEYKQNLTQLKEDLNSHLGNPLNLSDENTFNEFDKKIAVIQEKLSNGNSTLQINRNITTEYQETLQKLPNRPNIEGYVEPPAPDISIIKKRKETRAILRIGSVYNTQTQESGASATLVSNDGKNRMAQAANYYPSQKSDLKAAYQTLIQGLNEAAYRGYKALKIETSNNNLYQRLKGNPQYMHFNGKNKECEPLHKQAMQIAKSFEWGIIPRFTSYKKYLTAEQANQIATNAIAHKASVNDFSQSKSQQTPISLPLFEEADKTNTDLTIKNSEWTSASKIKIETSYSTTQFDNPTAISTLNITFDGASRNNGKPNAQAAAAAVLTNPEGRTKEFSQYLGNKTNNEAEFQAAIIGMKAAQEFDYKSIKLQGDSQLVVEALQGKRNIKAANLKPLYEKAVGLLQSFDKIEINYIPRGQNKIADALANKALDNAAQQVNPIANRQPFSEARSDIVVDNFKARNEPIRNHLEEKGHKLEQKSDDYVQLSSQMDEVQVSNKISKITSIGQFGADLGALEAASDKGIKTGGIAANGYFTEKGEASKILQSYGLSEGEKGKGFGQTYKNAYSANIRSTDATVLIGRILNRKEDTDKDLIEIINRYDKPYLVIPKEEVFSSQKGVGEKIAQFAAQNNAQSLNIIGERESHAPGIQNAVREAIGETLESVRGRERERVREERISLRGEPKYVDNKVKIPSPEQAALKQPPIDSPSVQTQNIHTTTNANSKNGSRTTLSSQTKLASELGNLQNNHLISYQDSEKSATAGNHGDEQAAHKIASMTEILKTKLKQRPKLVSAIAKRGGVKFLENSSYICSSQDKFWNGSGKESRFIQALSEAYTVTVEKEKGKTFLKNTDPVAQSLQQWAIDATFLNRNYIEAINKIQQIYGDTKKTLTDNQLKTISEDSKNATIFKEIQNIVTRLTNTLVQEAGEDGSQIIQGQKYILESNENTGLTRITSVDTADILLSIEKNQVKANNLNHDVYQSLKLAVEAVDENIKYAQDATGYNKHSSVNSTVITNQLIK